MDKKNLKEIARSVKESRIQKNYTQQELAAIAGISVRSIQRIENAEVFPRPYTLKTLAGHLDFTIEHELSPRDRNASFNQAQKIIFSSGIAILLVLLAAAYIFQSPTFPENAFELSLYIAALTGVYTAIMLVIWK